MGKSQKFNVGDIVRVKGNEENFTTKIDGRLGVVLDIDDEDIQVGVSHFIRGKEYILPWWVHHTDVVEVLLSNA